LGFFIAAIADRLNRQLSRLFFSHKRNVMYFKLNPKLLVSIATKLHSSGRYFSSGIAATLGVAALGASAPAEAARIYNLLPVAIYVCPLRWAVPMVEGWDNRDYANKTKYPDSNPYALTWGGGYGSLTRTGDACIFLDAGSAAAPTRSPSISWTNAIAVGARLAFSPSTTNRVDDRCIFTINSKEPMGHDFQGGNYLVLRQVGTKVDGKLYDSGNQVLSESSGAIAHGHNCPDILK